MVKFPLNLTKPLTEFSVYTRPFTASANKDFEAGTLLPPPEILLDSGSGIDTEWWSEFGECLEFFNNHLELQSDFILLCRKAQ